MGEEGNPDPGTTSNKPDLKFQNVNVGAAPGPVPARRHSNDHNNHHAEDRSAPSRNRPARPAQQSGSRNFEFVLVTDHESKRQVRRHAMRQYMHQRRLDSIARLGTARIPGGGWTPRSPSDSQVPESSPSLVEEIQDEPAIKSEKGSPSSEEDHPPPEKPKGPARLLIPKLHKVKREEKSPPSSLAVQKPTPKALDPLITPGEGSVRDPFSCYPIPVSHADHELIQHFVVTYPSMMYKFADSIANNPMMEIFRQFALHDGLPFQAMLAIASKHRAGVEGKTESVQSLTHKMRALRLMNERIQADSTGQYDGTIYAVATMAVIEKWSKDASIERMHFRGLASMIRSRGGMQGMRISSPFLEKVLYWVDFSCASKAIVSTSLPWTGAISATPPLDFLDPTIHLAVPHDSTTAEDSESLCETFRACEDFLRFFRRLRELERCALDAPYTLSPDAIPKRINYFTPGTQLYTILTMLPDYDHGIRDIRFIDEYTCMACLFFLAIALHDCYLNSTSLDPYMEWLSVEIRKMNPSTNPSITSVLWLFLNNGGYPPNYRGDTSARCWIVSRMVRVAKRLEWKRHGTIWDRLRQVLIDFIVTQQECALGCDQIDADTLAARQRKRLLHVQDDASPSSSSSSPEYFWNEAQMREDILNFSLSSITTRDVGDDTTNIPVFT
ncbi:transcriptional regulator family: Fungal Specific TF [Aspergillus niger]|uniref:Contig An04c0030, genomic contig n=3 Tax=Aspergillus niger TaxID=5061 RepID=A2QHP5_ASPNC|nr:uncharacterized protein An04g00590 [Aspergillus niger]RDH21107.1 hypothetical protein M747DRAFT_236079 [Aspergillus niger ATCC 13496]KAI2824633.1 transcriptional regulator family: Fungal Specific TF [Aspergillus niger]KAI2860659.1 transcriptional regulator family: Fungal Specific TF [Aspergillus niger]KAI2867754.1 transcriptional regulator family: Fungal Specific TF [Aspergillus niger]KAI2881082.1 transcriptional regulator family: Fungal Specific TF [Aspergillus niger]|eukprot:XP_001401423.1 hypothetical protein ANI_1_1546184 [Aspergillus niger CBS 513.88]